MSRSYRKTPIFGFTVADSEKFDKQMANRKFRKKTKDMIKKRKYEHLPIKLDQVHTKWDMVKDGKHYWGDAPLYYMGK